MATTRQQAMEIWLMGEENAFIRGAKLPSNRQVLEYYCYHSTTEKEKPRKAMNSAIKKS